MNTRFLRYVFQNVAAMIGVSVYILADTFFISLYGGANGIAFLNLVLPVYGLIFAIGAMIGVGSATRFLFSAVSILEPDRQYSVYTAGYFFTGQCTASDGSRSGADRTGMCLYTDFPYICTVFYGELYFYGLCKK